MECRLAHTPPASCTVQRKCSVNPTKPPVISNTQVDCPREASKMQIPRSIRANRAVTRPIASRRTLRYLHSFRGSIGQLSDARAQCPVATAAAIGATFIRAKVPNTETPETSPRCECLVPRLTLPNKNGTQESAESEITCRFCQQSPAIAFEIGGGNNSPAQRYMKTRAVTARQSAHCTSRLLRRYALRLSSILHPPSACIPSVSIL